MVDEKHAQEQYRSVMSGKKIPDDQIERWITVNGQHIPITKGQSEKEAIKQNFAGKGKRQDIPSSQSPSGFKKVDTETFVSTLKEAKATGKPEKVWRVTDPNAKKFDEEHPNAEKYITTAGGSTVAITPDGDIVAVCKNKRDTQRGTDLMEFAVKNGGKKLDSFSGNHKFYTKTGFEPVSWTRFDRQFAPDDWDEIRDDEEPIIFYKYTGNTTDEKAEDFIKRVPESKNYDEAKAIRDKEIK